jgi:hypothetical protein
LRASRRPSTIRSRGPAHGPQPDRAVEAFHGEIGQLLGQLQLHLQLRMAGLELRQRRPEPQPPKPKVAARRMRRPARSAAPAARLHRREAGEQAGRAFAQRLALGGGHHAPRGALEQLQAQPRLQRGQPLGDHRGHDVGRADAAPARLPCSRIASSSSRSGRSRRGWIAAQMERIACRIIACRGHGAGARIAMLEGFQPSRSSATACGWRCAAAAGRALLLLHGHPQTSACGTASFRRWPQRFELVLMDLRGYGDSGPAAAGEGSAPTASARWRPTRCM